MPATPSFLPPQPTRARAARPHLRRVGTALFAIALAALPAAASAWGPRGHAMVGEVAERALSPAARREVRTLLAGEPDPTLAGVANWADELRERDPDLGRRSARWHYVNMAEDDCAPVPARQCAGGDCVFAAIQAQRDVLADRTRPLDERRQALKFLVHFVGDAHQPLHAGFARDRGGNTHQIRHAGEGSNLHRLWDGALPARPDLSRRRHVHALTGLALPAGAAQTDPVQWAVASCRIVLQPGFYPRVGAEVGDDYLERWRPTADLQLRLAGDRLARLIESALVPTPAP